MNDNQDTFAEITREEDRLAELDRLREETRKRLLALRARVANDSSEPRLALPLPLLRTPGPKATSAEMKLFRYLFRGREDVFPKRWVNTKKATKGYAPACFNEWVPGVCEKPKVRCGECPNQAFIPVEDKIKSTG